MDSTIPIAIMAALGAIVVTALSTFKSNDETIPDSWGTQVKYVSSGTDPKKETVDTGTDPEKPEKKGVDSGTDPLIIYDDNEVDSNKCKHDALLEHDKRKILFPKVFGALDTESHRELLKAFTTKHASTYLLENNVFLHFKALTDIENALKKLNEENYERDHPDALPKIVGYPVPGHILRFKGGLALRLCLQDMLEIMFSRNQHHIYRKQITDGLLESYASPSDLDSNIILTKDYDDAELRKVADIAMVCLEQLASDEDVWKTHCQNIVDLCNADVAGKEKLKQQGVDVIDFFMHSQYDMIIKHATAKEEAKHAGLCAKRGCITLEKIGSEGTVYTSDNETLEFNKGLNNQSFLLLRAKFGIKVKYNNTCIATCPAELLDVAIPRKGDKAYDAFWDSSHSAKGYKYENAANGVSVSAVNLKFQLYDLTRILNEFVVMTDKEDKGAKRAHRYFLLATIHNLIFENLQENCASNDKLSEDMMLTKQKELNDALVKMIAENKFPLDTKLIETLCLLKSIRSELEVGDKAKDFWQGKLATNSPGKRWGRLFRKLED
jgi:hypothetical protein